MRNSHISKASQRITSVSGVMYLTIPFDDAVRMMNRHSASTTYNAPYRGAQYKDWQIQLRVDDIER